MRRLSLIIAAFGSLMLASWTTYGYMEPNSVSRMYFQNMPCPIDGSSSYFTGTVMTDSATGKLLKLYHCPRGHNFWVPAY
jgi:hypothetical protein